jgi:RNA polymerase sigma factor (sigma-70 family)
MTIEPGLAVDDDFRVLFEVHAGRVVRFARLLGADDPENIAQEAFCRLYARRDDLETAVAEAGPYLNRTVVNLVRDRHRRETSHRRFRRLSVRDHERFAPSAEELGVRSDEGRRVLAALDAIPRRRREAIVLRYWLDLPYAAIADAMGVSVGSAKSAVSRGLDDLHAHLEDR